jgi:Fe-S-cluster-containing hydrogenase component 2
MNPELVEGLFIRDDDEGLFSRDIDGQLVRLDSPTAADYGEQVTLQIDGQSVTVPLAEPLKDAQGNFVLDKNGETIPRYTTIYDAARKLYVRQPGDEAKIPIPTLCHQEHMKPVAVCRLCVVQIYGTKRGKRAAERKLLPACQHQVKEGMEVFTMNAPGSDGDRVRNTVKMLTEMLAVDNLKPADPPALEKEFAPFNELGVLASRCGAQPQRLKQEVLSAPPPPAKPLVGRRSKDTSSTVFQVDHGACILCERCIRACDDVQQNLVIGRTGKGANAGISFDLNDEMGSSSCVSCGECMVSCPTSAITYKPGTQVNVRAGDRSQEILSATELLADPLFNGISPKFLLWQQGLVVRRKLKAGDVLCRQGDPGNTAFIVKSGKLEVTISAPPKTSNGFLSRWLTPTAGEVKARFNVTPADVITGEMACMSGTPRTAAIKALEPGEVWEIRRNVLDRLMRLPTRRKLFEEAYRGKVLDLALRDSELFQNLDDKTYKEIVDYIRTRISFVRVRPGQVLFEQGAEADALYFVRLGHIRVGLRRFEAEAKVLSRGPGAVIGEIALLGLSRKDILKTEAEIDADLARALESAGGNLNAAIRPGKRTATCSALGHVELVRLSREDFLEMVRQFPVVRRRLIAMSMSRLRGERVGEFLLNEYVAQGLYEGRSILVLDLDRCTRCDQCTRGCVEEHGRESHGVPLPRLLRDGERFDKYVVATSCRSCTDAHCMIGCPVDSIHRGRHLQIVIEDHCIGCGLCASNCPYGSIFMAPNQLKSIAPLERDSDRKARVAPLKAAACDLCDSHGRHSKPEPQCVASCPHDAAFRVSGPELLRMIAEHR